ncbi:pyruvate decarboxylase [Auriculariales sp. MPI-PUGE-AT-0066]|nr:pyruvate decarboxylase [Auriculariales sp. MPI-PUGE-AT-0066]
MSSSSSETTSIADYILARLEQLGVRSIFGVPGDFELTLLDKIEDHGKLEWIGCCNELNAAYAADGYARVSKGLGVLVTTFGVGELSAINGVAGAFSERVPMLHLVGVPSTDQQAHKAILHHTLGDGRFNIYADAASQVTIAQEHLMGTEGAGAQIDRVIISALTTCRPTYLTLPTDLVHAQIPKAPLSRPLTLEIVRAALYSEPGDSHLDQRTAALDAIVKLYKAAKSPVVLIDACAVRYDVVPLVRQLVMTTGMPFFTTSMAKGAIDEKEPLFAGVYVGEATVPAVKANIDKADLIITIGLMASDFNSGGFTFRLPGEATVELHSDHTEVAGTQYPGVTFFTLLPMLPKALVSGSNASSPHAAPAKEGIFAAPTAPSSSTNSPITHAWFWPTVSRYFKDGDVILSETGTSNFGLVDVEFPPRVTAVNQILFGSIGWSVGATLGAATAAKEAGRRCLAFIGDGSAQVTVQDFSTMLRHNLTPVVVLLNNDGYTIERLINGPQRKYNDIQPWRWSQLLSTFGATDEQVSVHRCATPEELVTVLDAGFPSDKMVFLEVVMAKLDAPRLLNFITHHV